MKYVIASFLLLLVVVLSWAGFRGGTFKKGPLYIFPDMDFQWKLDAQDSTTFFADGRGDRPVIAGTVPTMTDLERTFPQFKPKDGFFEDTYLATGRIEGSFGQGFPYELTQLDMQRGQVLFNRYCAICHGQSADGNGVTKQFGMGTVANLQQARIVDMPEGQIFDTITNGFNTMGPYGHKITEEDRWRVIAYLRALQLAADAPQDAVPAAERGRLGL